MNELMKWYRATVCDASTNSVAERAGVTQSTLARQLKAGVLSHEVAVAVARAFGADAIHALLLTGLIAKEDLRRHGASAALRDAKDVEFSQEVIRRLAERRGHHPDFDTPIGGPR